MIQGPSLRLAMNGDRVRARVTSSPEEPRRAGEIVDVLVHSRQTVVGIFRRMGNLPVLAPEDESPLFISPTCEVLFLMLEIS
jgi:exoribonuclease R